MNRTITAVPGAVAERRINDELLLVPVGSDVGKIDSLYTLNETAAFVWEKAKAGTTEADIQASLMECYEVDAGKAERDVADVLDQLIAFGALSLTRDTEA